MRHEWDEKKNRLNLKKHGVSFEVAALALEDEQQRWHALGVAQLDTETRAVLLVVHVHREVTDGEEVVRIVPARRADKHEVKRYQEQEMD